MLPRSLKRFLCDVLDRFNLRRGDVFAVFSTALLGAVALAGDALAPVLTLFGAQLRFASGTRVTGRTGTLL